MLKNEIHRIYLDKNNNEVTINRFNVTYHYTILEQINDLPQYGYAVLNHLYANPGLEADFERVFLNRDKHLENTEGFENLLFLKPHSTHEHHVIITFWQMLGRGTRLCENLYGQGIDKESFLIFDWLDNFEFFRVNPNGIDATIGLSLTQRIYNMRLDIVRELQDLQYQQEPLQGYRQSLVTKLSKQVKELNQESFRVKQNIQYVVKYRHESQWKSLAILEKNEIKRHISPLIEATDEEELAKRFDLLMLTIELATLTSNNASVPIKKVMETAKDLSELGSIPQIREHADIIKDVQNDSFWLQSSIERLEEVRYSLRGLIKFIEKNKRKIYYTNFEDEVIEQESGEPIYDVNDLHSYKEKVNHYIKENKDHVAVYKLYHNKPLTKNDVEALEEVLWKELGTKEQYEKNYSNKSVTVLVREIVGLDKQAVNEVFSEFLTEGRLNSNQIDFLKRIIDYISQNGILEKKELLRDPFRQLGTISKLFEDNQDDAKKIIEIIDYINENGTVS